MPAMFAWSNSCVSTCRFAIKGRKGADAVLEFLYFHDNDECRGTPPQREVKIDAKNPHGPFLIIGAL